MRNKAKKLARKIEKLPSAEQKAVEDYFKKNPEKIYVVQKSLKLGYSDLPIFQAQTEENQQKLF